MSNTQTIRNLRQGLVCGAAGGLAEIAWVSLYAYVTGSDAAPIARGVTTAAGVTALLPAQPAALGVVVHMLLALTLGVALVAVLRLFRRSLGSPAGLYAFMLAALTGVWMLNFFVLLPVLSPAFVHMVPYAVSLTSKLLFGIAVAQALIWMERRTLAARVQQA